MSDSHEQRPPSGGMIFKLFKINTSNYLLDFYLIVHFEIVYFPRISEQLCRYFDWDNIQRNNNNPANLRKYFTILSAWQVSDHITQHFQVRKSTSRTQDNGRIKLFSRYSFILWILLSFWYSGIWFQTIITFKYITIRYEWNYFFYQAHNSFSIDFLCGMYCKFAWQHNIQQSPTIFTYPAL